MSKRQAQAGITGQCAKKSALPLLIALLSCAAAVPAAAEAESPASATAVNKSGGLKSFGLSICEIDTKNMDLGIVPTISDTIISASSAVQITCRSLSLVSVTTKFCLMFYPDPAYDQFNIKNQRPLFGKADLDTNTVPYLHFQMYIGDQLWGAGAANGDYGEGYSNTTGAYVRTSFSYSITAKMNLSDQTNWGTKPGYYSNHFIVQMNYTNRPFQGSASGLCKPDQSGLAGLGVGTAKKSILVHTSLKPACGLITGGTLDFGRQYRLTDSIQAHSALTVKCTGGTDYSVEANAGRNADNAGTNAMKCATADSCGGSAIPYLLYDDAGNVWNSKRQNPYVQKDHMDSSGSKTYKLTAKTTPMTSSPPPGTYKDTIIFTLAPAANP